MGTYVPEIGDYAESSGHALQNWIRAKEAWARDRAMQGNKVADVHRYSQTGGVPYAHVKPIYTLVPDMTALPVYVDEESRNWLRAHGGVDAQTDKVFVFYDVPGGAGILPTDRIVFDGSTYEVGRTELEVESGRCEVLARLIKAS